MQADLADYLARHTPLAVEEAVWGDGRISLRITTYLAEECPPLVVITSVRSLVFRDDTILVLRNQHSVHIVPGGRREAGETLEATLRREVLEETGWQLTTITLLGFRHLHHLAPKLPDYLYPHPDFFWGIYMADAAELMPEGVLANEYELEAVFRPITEVQTLDLTPGEQLYLDAALKLRRGRPTK